MESNECREKCQLFRFRDSQALPPEARLAWAVFSRLTSPAVQRFGLEADVLGALNLRLTDRGVLDLVDHLDAIIEGNAEAAEADNKPKG